jgi:hypothetical protein
MTHLSSEQISGWVLGERDSDVDRHLQICKTCHEDLARFQDGLSAFRQSAHRWAEQPSLLTGVAPVFRMRGLVRAAAVIAVTSSIALLPLYLDIEEARRETAQIQDSWLLNAVDERLSRSVPRSMEHLLELMNEGKEDLQ